MTKLFLKALRAPQRLRQLWFIHWNRIVLRMLIGENLGVRARIYTKVYFNICDGATVKIGDDFIMTSDDCYNPLCRHQRGCIVAERPTTVIDIGHNTGLSSPCVWAKERITIGNYVNMGGDCILMDSDAHSLDWRVRDSGEMVSPKQSRDNAEAKCAPIVIEDHVLIGARSIILKGVTIGEGSVIGAGSVVVKSIPPHCIAAGNPAKVIKLLH